ncbi:MULTISPECIES: sulfite exporter TauE/SafE family protein [unclassified Avibacterium]|uniref:sulfite exporter TauE/SafE family protein n=1 Tax=unclassified Avibacterium TaxID=2685287 RepID=UPI002026843F|nr:MULTISPECIES: sulfite exporter TauE/SafE family protein [unclassified Avibacterium]MCW9699988.1 sulfite exporter TauE/SafE family protein [Avibacterium sp. 20-129]MCW9733682.1 sulfite exporter TauE/SafE family protein [Avibacterium sp. 20-15]URL03533.1 sulfite exporter TauE/SafE family protein [Avibacterium sp. 20-132]
MTFSLIIILLLCGILTNLMSAIFGIGGGVLMVPILHTLFPYMPIQMISATSLTIVMGSALINLFYFYKLNIEIDKKKLLLWSLSMIIGVQLGFHLSFNVSDNLIIGVFVITLIVLALKTFLHPNNKKKQQAQKKDCLRGSLFCFLGGGIAGITGIGGGSIMSPLISQLPSVSIKSVAVYTNYMMVIGGIGNLYGYLTKTPEVIIPHSLQIGYVSFSIVLIVVLSAFFMSFISMKLRGIIKEETARKLLSMILLFIACYMLLLRVIQG